MVSDQTKLYPSGFVGLASLKQTEPLDIVSTAKLLFNNSYIKKSTPYTASADVEELWSMIISGDELFKTFDFKEKILKLAISVFKDMTVSDWIDLQYQSEQTNSHHYKWIDETLQFVYGSQQRQLSVNNWCVILKAGDGNIAREKYSNVVKDYVFNGSALVNRSRQSMKKLILHWVRQQDGIADLAGSLKVLYGQR